MYKKGDMRCRLILLVAGITLNSCGNLFAARSRLMPYKGHKVHRKKADYPQLPARYIPLPLVRQTTNWTCGVAALQSVLGYFGIEFREDQLAQRLQSNEEIGTNYKNIVSVATEYLKQQYPKATVTARTGMTLKDIEQALTKGNPVQVAFQAWADDPATTKYATDDDDGHYAVIVGHDENNFYFMDPSTIGNYTYIPKEEFLERWHDVDGESHQPVIHFGIEYSVGYGFKPIVKDFDIIKLARPEKYPYQLGKLPTKRISSALLEVPKTRQSTNWTSQLAVLQSVLYYFGVEYRQDTLAQNLSVSASVLQNNAFITLSNGAVESFLLSELKKNYPQARVEFKQEAKIADILEAVDQGIPVIVELEPWTDSSSGIDDGRYAVVVGYNRTILFLMSPSQLGYFTYITKVDFQKRWKKNGLLVSNGTARNEPTYHFDAVQKLG